MDKRVFNILIAVLILASMASFFTIEVHAPVTEWWWWDKMTYPSHWWRHENHTITYKTTSPIPEGRAYIEVENNDIANVDQNLVNEWVSYVVIDNTTTGLYMGFWCKADLVDTNTQDVTVGFYEEIGQGVEPDDEGIEYIEVYFSWYNSDVRFEVRCSSATATGKNSTYHALDQTAWYWFEFYKPTSGPIYFRYNGTLECAGASTASLTPNYFEVRQAAGLTSPHYLGEIDVDLARLTDDFEFPPSESPPTAELDDTTITNMEGCGNWVFAEEKYYDFVGAYEGVDNDTVDTVGISFLDYHDHNITAFYNFNDEEFTLHSGGDYVILQAGSYEFNDTSQERTNLNVTFPIYFRSTIVDTEDIDIWMMFNETGYAIPWTLISINVFNIYNLGGQELDSFSSTGNAGRLPGGDIFDFYAHNNSEVEASVIYRHLQHVKMLPEVTFMYDSGANYATFRLTYGIDYCLSDEDDFIDGWEVELLANEIDIVGERHINFTVSWYRRSSTADGSPLEHVKTEFNYFFTRAVFADDKNGSTRIWFDFWFNRINASTTVAGRVNAYEYPMKDSAPGWMALWGASTWGVDDLMPKESMMLGTLRDYDGNVTSASEVKLVRVRFKLKVYTGSKNQIVTVQNYNVFDLSIGDKTQPFRGIQTPVFDESRVPTMQVSGWLGFLWTGLLWIADAISRAFGPSILGFWTVFVGFLDTIFAWLGLPNAFSNFIALILDAWNWLTIAVLYVVTMITQGFLLLVEVMGKFVSLITTVVTQWVVMAQNFWWILDTGFYTTVSVWDQLNIGTWIIIGAILYPIHIIFLWDEYGFDAAIAEISFFIGVVAFFIKGFLTIINFTINLIYTIIEFIPVAE